MKAYTGINIQFPMSRLIIDGVKTIETRTYPIPPKYLNKELLIIETPGKMGAFKARVIGKILFSSCFKYRSANQFYADFYRHKVGRSSPFAWKDKPKWGWVVASCEPFERAIPAPKRKGIRFTTGIFVR